MRNPPDSALRMAAVTVENSVSDVSRRCVDYQVNSSNNFDEKKLKKLYNSDSLLQQAIDTPVEDSLSAWRTDVEWDSEFMVKQNVIESIKSARLLREVAILPVLIDSKGKFIPFSMSVEDARDKRNAEVSHLIISKNFKPSEENESDLFSENFDKPKNYSTNSSGKEIKIHHSRIVVVKGSRGDHSAAEAFMYYFSKFHDAYEEMVRATGESNIWTLGTDLHEIAETYKAQVEVGNTPESGSLSKALEKRLENFRDSVSGSRGSYIYDKNLEQVDRKPVTNLDSIVKSVDKSLDILCAAVDIVPSRFLGKSFGSLNSSNKADIVNMAMMACNFQSQFAEPVLNKLDGIFAKLNGKEKPEYEWNPIKAEQLTTPEVNNEPLDQ